MFSRSVTRSAGLDSIRRARTSNAFGPSKNTLKIYPYTPGGFGTSIATALEGKVRLERDPPIPPTKFIEGSGKSFNTVPPSDFSYFEMINELVQLEPANSTSLLGQLAAIGIVKGKPFNPDARMKKILTDAAAVGNAAGRVLNWRAAEIPGWSLYPNSMWANTLWMGGFENLTGERFVTIAHELGHIFCGHLGACASQGRNDEESGWADRRTLGSNEKEVEAEAVAYLVASRAELITGSAAYLKTYAQRADMKSIDVELIVRGAARIERLPRFIMAPWSSAHER